MILKECVETRTNTRRSSLAWPRDGPQRGSGQRSEKRQEIFLDFLQCLCLRSRRLGFEKRPGIQDHLACRGFSARLRDMGPSRRSRCRRCARNMSDFISGSPNSRATFSRPGLGSSDKNSASSRWSRPTQKASIRTFRADTSPSSCRSHRRACARLDSSSSWRNPRALEHRRRTLSRRRGRPGGELGCRFEQASSGAGRMVLPDAPTRDRRDRAAGDRPTFIPEHRSPTNSRSPWDGSSPTSAFAFEINLPMRRSVRVRLRCGFGKRLRDARRRGCRILPRWGRGKSEMIPRPFASARYRCKRPDPPIAGALLARPS